MQPLQLRTGLASALVLASLSACGGGSGGIASTPPPQIAPTPSPSPSPTPTPTPPAPPPGPIGLTSDKPFAVVAASGVTGDLAIPGTIDAQSDVRFEYVPAEDRYRIELPGYDPGRLRTIGYNGSYNGNSWQSVSGTYNAVSAGDTSTEQAVHVTLAMPKGPLNPDVTTSYTSWGIWRADHDARWGYFAYGIPTEMGEVPVTGQANYDARVFGLTDSNGDVGGTAHLQFNFAAGTLAGYMNPEFCPWDCYSLGRYDFVNTLYGVGSRRFSGAFAVPGTSLPSSFNGSFNGPRAAEVMARWQAPFLNRDTGNWEQMAGIWIGGRRP